MQAALDLEAPIRETLANGNLGATLAMSFAAGVATSLTPCVYPMIAVTVSVFGARQAKSRSEGALLSSSFVLGMAALFVPLGLIAAKTGGLFGAALANPAVLIGLALLFTALACSMFGAFSLDLPSGLKTRLSAMGGVGPRGAFVLGMISALIAAPCTGPVLGGLLTWVSSSADWTVGALGLFAYALGLGLLFWLVGTFAITLPKSGRWLGWVKSVFGIVMLAAAAYYLRPLLPSLALPGWLSGRGALFAAGALLVGAGVLAGAIHLSFEYSSRNERLRKASGIVVVLVGLLFGLRGAESTGHDGLKFRADYRAALAEARATGRPALVDFSASWCGACGELDRHTFSHPDVVREAERFITVRVDLSPGVDSPDKRQLLSSYAQRGLPLVVLHDEQGREVSRVTGFMEPEAFLSLLRKIN